MSTQPTHTRCLVVDDDVDKCDGGDESDENLLTYSESEVDEDETT